MKTTSVFLLSICICTLCMAIVPDEYGIVGSVWCDDNGNNVWEPVEPGIGGVTVTLISQDGSPAWSGTTITDNKGCYQLAVPGAGTYSVWINRPPTGTTPPSKTVTVTTTEPWKNAAGFAFSCTTGCTGRLGDYVWFDANGDGIQGDASANEVGLPGVRLILKNSQGAAVATTQTDDNGKYEFIGLCAGSYVVQVDESTLPREAGLVPASCRRGNDPAMDNNCSPAPVTLTADTSEDLTIDFGYRLPTGEEICTQDPANPGRTIPLGKLTVTVDSSGDVTVAFEESRNINDNSYGANTVNWPRNHNFSDLVGSDKAEFLFKDATGKTVFDFCLDYISVKAGTPSGYASLGVNGGEGKVLLGQASWLLEWSTSLADNLNNWGLCTNGSCGAGGVNLITNSPPTSPSTTYNVAPQFAAWEFSIIYAVKVSHLAFGSAGFGSVTIPAVHNSPPKIGANAASQIPCTPQPPTTCGECKGGVVQLTLLYTGDSSTDHTVVVYEGTKREASKKLTEVVVGPSSSDNNEFTFTGTGKDLKMGTEISLWVDGVLNTAIHTSCSQPIGPGLVRGDFKVVEGYSKDGGKLCPMP